MLSSIFRWSDPHAARADRIDAMADDIAEAKERQAMSSLYVTEAANRAAVVAHETTIAARNAAALVSRKR